MSRWVSGLNPILHGGAAVCAWSLGWSALPFWVIAVVMVASAWRVHAQHALRCAPDAVVRIGLPGEDWRFGRRDGTAWRVPVDAVRAFVHPWLVVIVLRSPQRRVAVLIARDACDADAHRRLRVGLRIGRTGATPG